MGGETFEKYSLESKNRETKKHRTGQTHTKQ